MRWRSIAEAAGSLVLGLGLACAGAGAEGPTPEPATDEADQEIVVTASLGKPLPKGEETGTLSVVSSEEIDAQSAAHVHEILENVPGVHMVQTGGPGESSSMFMRGGESDHVLVMIDGHQVNSDGGGFDWKNLVSQNIGRIEVMRGTGSALFGSDALVGAVNIITGRRRGPPEVKLSAAGGTYDTLRETLSVTGGDASSDYSVNVSHLRVNDYMTRRTGCENATLWGSFGAKLGEKTDLRLTVRTEDSEREWGSTAGPPATNEPDPNAWNDRQSDLLGLEVVHAASERWTSRVKVSRYGMEELFANDADPVNDEDSRHLSVFDRTVVDWQNEIGVAEGPNGRLDAVVGLEFDQESLETNDDFVKPSWLADDHNSGSTTRASRAVYAQLREELYGWLRLEANYRHERHDTLGDEDSFRFGAAAVLEETGTRLRASAGVAYKEPTIFETDGLMTTAVFGTTTGNPDLDAEGCEGYDVSAEQDLLGGKLKLGTTWFRNRYTDYIVFTGLFPNYTFGNAGRAKSQGWEHFLEYSPTDELAIRANYTHNNHRATKSDNSSLLFLEGKRLARRPNDMVNVTVTYEPIDRLKLFAEWNHVGSRTDVDWGAFERVRLCGYDRVDLAASWQASRHLRVFARWENIGDVQYEEVFGFGAPGSNVLAGLEWSTTF